MLVTCIVSVVIFAIPTTILAAFWIPNQEPLWTFSTFGNAGSVAVSQDGTHVAVGVLTSYYQSQGQIVLLNKEGTVLWTRNSSLITSVAISADGSRIAASGVVTKVITSSPYSAQQTGIVYYYDQAGNMIWSYSTGLNYVFDAPPLSPPSFRVMLSQDASRVVVDTGTGVLVLDSLGHLLWSYAPNCIETVCTWLTLASADASFIVNINDDIHAFNGNGVSLWNSSRIPEPDLVNGVMSRDGKYVLLEWYNYWDPTNRQPTLMLLNNTGANIWNRTLAQNTVVPAMSSDDSAIVMSPGGMIGSIDFANKLVWNTTHTPANLLTTTSHGSYTAAVIALGLGHEVLRILDSSGRTVWGYGDFGEIDALALSGDDAFLAIAAGPYSNFSNGSATVVFLPGPQTLATERGPTYAWFTFDPNTQNNPWLFVLPAVFASVPLLFLLFRKTVRVRNQRVEGSNPQGPLTDH